MSNVAILQEHSQPSSSEAGTEDLAAVSFDHLRKGNYKRTETAIRAFLKSQGFPPQGYYAEIIMLLEMGFAYCYGKGERSHYQQVMPSSKWRKGDTLSEKLPRCKDKETFKRRFDRIGLTDILRREHFGEDQIILDFDGHLYYRLIDSRRNNLSRFYRNDKQVAAFIAEALLFYRNQKAELRRRRIADMIVVGNAEEVSRTKAEQVGREIPNPLLTDDLNKKETKRHKRISLTLIYSPNGTTPNPTSEKREDIGGADSDPAELVGLKPPKQSRKANSPKHRIEISGTMIYAAWRSAVLVSDPTKFITASPPAKDLRIASDFGKRLQEFYPHLEPSQFFAYLAENWISAYKHLKEQGAFGLAFYPLLPALLKYSDLVLTWFKSHSGIDGTPRTSDHGEFACQPKPCASASASTVAATRPEERAATAEEILEIGRKFFGKG